MSTRRGLNTLFVVVLAVLGVAWTQPEYLLPWQPWGWVGISRDPDGLITDVAADSPAARAGIVAGDRLDLARASLDDRRWIGAVMPVGLTLHVPIQRGSAEKIITLTSVERTRTTADNVSNAIETFAALVTIVVSAVLVLFRPSAMTWGFFLYALASVPTSGWLYVHESTIQSVFDIVAFAVLVAFGQAGLVSFAARFPNDAPTGWRAGVARYSWLFIPAYLIPSLWSVYQDLFGQGSVRFDTWLTYAGYAILWFAFVLFVDALRTTKGQDRQRMQWTCAALVIVISTWIAERLVLGFGITRIVWLSNVAGSVQVLVPLTVAYVLIKRRVVDVSFVLSRAVVYGAVTAIVIICFAGLDWIFGRVLASTQWAVPAELLAAVGIGFGLNSMEKRVDRVVDGVLFRRRHLAEVRLQRVALTVPHAPAFEVVDEFLVREPADAFELTSAAVFRRDESGMLVRTASTGWGDCDLAVLGPGDSLVLQLVAIQSHLRMREVLWQHADLPAKEGAPTVAFPIIVRHQLRGLVLYGTHRSGADFDDDELRSLTELMKAAAAAYDHIEAEALRTRVSDLTAALARLMPA